jgi:hypothetical protein
MLDRFPRWSLHLAATLFTLACLLVFARIGPPYDDCTYVTAGHLTVEGDASASYDQQAINARHRELHPEEGKRIGPFFYSPIFLRAAAPMAGMSFESARLLNQLLILLSIGGILFLLLQRTESGWLKALICLIFVVSNPVTTQFLYQNWSAHLGLFVALALYFMVEKKNLPAAIAWALAIHLKAYIALFLVPLLFAGRRRLAAAIVVTGLVLVVVSLPWVGIDSYTAYAEAMRDEAGDTITYFFNQVSVQSTLARYEYPPGKWPSSNTESSFGILGWIVWLSLAIWLALLYRLRHDEWRALAITIPYLLLFIPKIWDHSQILFFGLLLVGVLARRTKAILLAYLLLSFPYFSLVQHTLLEAIKGTGSVGTAHAVLLYYPVLNLLAAAAILSPPEEPAEEQAAE